MTKKQARALVDAMALPAAQVRAAYRTIARATASENIEVRWLDTRELIITRSRPGRVGWQVFEDTIRLDGGKQVVQRAYDASGQLIHDDPKGGTP